MSAEELLAELRTAIDNIHSEIAIAESALADAHNRLSVVNSEIKGIQNQRDAAKTHYDNESAELCDALEILRKEKVLLDGEVSALIAEKGDLKVENMSLYKQNESFRSYEQKGIKALKSAEESLIAREKTIIQKESLRPLNNGILPPR